MKQHDEIFQHNLIEILTKSLKCSVDDVKSLIFTIEPKEERGKNYSTTDEYIRLWLLSDKNVLGRQFSFVEVVRLLTSGKPYYSLWIRIHLKEESKVVKLEVSLRFRTLNVITKTQETEFPPFSICT